MALETFDLKLKKNKDEDQAEAVERAQEAATKKKKRPSLIREDDKYWYFKFV